MHTERPDWNVMLATCPSRTSLARVANKWTAMIVITLSAGPVRFGDIRTRSRASAAKFSPRRCGISNGTAS